MGEFERRCAEIEALRSSQLGRARNLPRNPFLEEVAASAGVAGAVLDPAAVAALVERGFVTSGLRLSDCIAVADYAHAAAYVRAAPLARSGRPFLRVEEVVELHRRATRRTPEARPGLWRNTTRRAFPSGMVAPPAWLIPREIDALVERLAAGPPRDRPELLWISSAHERFERIHPFSAANGRTGRLVANLMLRRVGLPPLIVRPRDAPGYLDALRRADSGDPLPLATLFARSILRTLSSLSVEDAVGELGEIPRFAGAQSAAGLYKAAQRGRLRTVRRGGKLLTTERWIADYRSSRRGSA